MTVPGPFTMSQQAQNDFYASAAEMALDYAAAVNAEIKDLFAAGADIVQIDEPYMQARPEKAREYGLKALNRALDGVKGTTAVHICFGYAAIIHVRPSGYSFLPELENSLAKQISIETAQSSLDCSVLTNCRRRRSSSVCSICRTTTSKHPRWSPRASAARSLMCRRADRGRSGLRPQVSAARRRVRQNGGDGRRREYRAARARRQLRGSLEYVTAARESPNSRHSST